MHNFFVKKEVEMGRKEIIKEAKKTLEKDMKSFLKEKQIKDYSMVVNLETGEMYSYKLPPSNALKAAYVAQIMRKIGKINDMEFVIMYSASREFQSLDSKIEFLPNNNLLRLGDFYTQVVACKKPDKSFLCKKIKKNKIIDFC